MTAGTTHQATLYSHVPNVPLVLTVPRYTNDCWHHHQGEALPATLSQMYRWCLQYHVAQ
jgi:hypothetical protein